MGKRFDHNRKGGTFEIEQPKVGPKGEPSGSERVKGHREHGAGKNGWKCHGMFSVVFGKVVDVDSFNPKICIERTIGEALRLIYELCGVHDNRRKLHAKCKSKSSFPPACRPF
jgi:hypothetical protein